MVAGINEIFVKSSFKKIFHIQRKNIPHLKDETVQRLRIENIFFIFWKYLIYHRKKKLIFNILFKRINILKIDLDELKSKKNLLFYLILLQLFLNFNLSNQKKILPITKTRQIFQIFFHQISTPRISVFILSYFFYHKRNNENFPLT